MNTPKRILFVTSAVTPFVDDATASLSRSVAERLYEDGDFDVRIMMPRYGTISERTHSLHEVIRLSGTEVEMGDAVQTITTQVASLPETRLQVYFMGNETYFDRKGVFTDEGDTPYDDNAGRALFFNRAVLATIKKLRWGPDVIHAFGWAGSLLPLVLRTEYAGDDLFAQTKTLFTPDGLNRDMDLTDDFASTMALDPGEELLDHSFTEVGTTWADTVVYPPEADAPAGAEQFGDEATRNEQVSALYDQVLGEAVA